MCGITGIFAFNELGRFNMINLSKATDALQQRGRDSRGLYNNHHVGLGHRRLSIIDLTSDGRQPMADETGRYQIVFNGEIYNYKSLKEELLLKGITFQSQTDTEVLLQLFILSGASCLQQLHGFFAFAIYDVHEDSLFLARDRMGIKPLLYYHDDDKLIFASEMKSLLAYGIEKKIDFDSLRQYLQLQYVPAPHTMIQGVKKLMPGQYLALKQKQTTLRYYYTIPYQKNFTNPEKLSYEQQQQKLAQLMEQSVERRLVADVPLGTFLSGGIDSSIVTGLASRKVKHLNSFSIGFKDEPFFDETKYANLVARHFKTDHTVFSLTNNDLYGYLHQVLAYIDEPFADSSALPVFILSKHTRMKATVALSGDGADELFAGYHKHAAAYKAIRGGVLAGLVKTLLPLWQVLPKSRNGLLSNKFRQLQRFGEGMRLSPADRYWRWAAIASEQDAAALLKNQDKYQDYHERKQVILQAISGKEDINDILYTDMQLVLPNDMLTKVDLMSMACGLEVRVPFLDHEVVNFAFSLPADSKINGAMKKRILQDTFRDMLPAKLYNRPKKGFEVPLLKWFRGDLKNMICNDLLADDFIQEQGIFSLEEVRKLKQKLFSHNPGDVHAQIWGLIVFQTWYKQYFLV